MDELNFEQIGKKLREKRVSQGFTQEYVASMVNVNTSHVSNIENNHVKVSLSTLVKMCNTLNTTVDYILFDEYDSRDSVLDKEILKELKNYDDAKKQKILKIVKIL